MTDFHPQDDGAYENDLPPLPTESGRIRLEVSRSSSQPSPSSRATYTSLQLSEVSNVKSVYESPHSAFKLQAPPDHAPNRKQDSFRRAPPILYIVLLVASLSLLIALAAFVLALVSLLSNGTANSDEQQLEELRNALRDLEQRQLLESLEFQQNLSRIASQFGDLEQNTVNSLQQNLSRTTTELTNTTSMLRDQLNSLSAIVQNVSTQNPPAPADGTLPANLTIANLYDGCTTTMLSSCPFGPAATAPGFAVCDTAILPLDVSGHYTIDVRCAETDEEGENNPIITTLRVFPDGTAHCVCSLVIPTTMSSFITTPLQCAMFVTRCPIDQTLIADVQT